MEAKVVSFYTEGEFEEILNRYFKKHLPELLPQPVVRATTKIPLKELSSIYGWGESTLYGWCKRKFIPHFKIEREYWFDIQVIDRWIEDKKVRTQDEILNDFEKGRKFNKSK
ncbi:MAG: helix-turn-helix domain-containing protein [Chitinophagales bacterium]|nr:helix-turn-helix domain-containing protein [Chitinophagales bacterium]